MKAFLSYMLDPEAVVWPGEPNIQVSQCTTTEEKGYNTFQSILPNHCGTHYDAPNHFVSSRMKITELPIDYFWFENVAVVDAPKKPLENVEVEDLKPYEEEIQKADLLLIKTGFCKMRREQPEVYQTQSPALAPATCKYLVETFPNLKTVGFDFLSIGSYPDGNSMDSHLNLLGKYTEHFVTGIEDMDLMPLFETDKKIKRVIAAPLRIVQIDSSQVCVIAEFED